MTFPKILGLKSPQSTITSPAGRPAYFENLFFIDKKRLLSAFKARNKPPLLLDQRRKLLIGS